MVYWFLFAPPAPRNLHLAIRHSIVAQISYLMGNQGDLEIEAKRICMKVANDDYQLETYERQLETALAQLTALGQGALN